MVTICLGNIGAIYFFLGNDDLSLRNSLEAYDHAGDHKEAIKYLRPALNFFVKSKERYTAVRTLGANRWLQGRMWLWHLRRESIAIL